MRDKEDQRVTVAGIAKKLLPKVESLGRSLKDDLELLDYVEPSGEKRWRGLSDTARRLSEVEIDLRDAIEG